MKAEIFMRIREIGKRSVESNKLGSLAPVSLHPRADIRFVGQKIGVIIKDPVSHRRRSFSAFPFFGYSSDDLSITVTRFFVKEKSKIYTSFSFDKLFHLIFHLEALIFFQFCVILIHIIATGVFL
jgi:hypothetical protein